jgi:dTDP-4-dehydrorhamnose reductase
MRILLLGKYGQLGWELQRTLATLGQLFSYDFPEIDLRNQDQIHRLLRDSRPEVIINATAYTPVDKAESEEDVAMMVNADAAGFLAQEAFDMDAALIHYSTDYVFDGTKSNPYVENDTPNPLGVYGRSKLAGEQAIQQTGGAYLILRTSWVYSLRRESFVTKVLNWSRGQRQMRVVSDQVSNPTWARMLAEITSQMLARADDNPVGWLRERSGLYHLAGSGYTSRYEWAQAILKYDPKSDQQIVEDLTPAATDDFPTPAKRPLFTALNCDLFTKTFKLSLPEWEVALQLAMAQDL